MRFARGVVKIPIKMMYVFLIVVSTSFFLYLHILKYQRIKSYNQCRLIPELRKSSASKDVHENSQQSTPVCGIDPTVRRYYECPECFRPNVKNITRDLNPVNYSISMFPRGPPGLFTLKNEIQQDYIRDYLITPRSVCVESCPYLIAVLLSISDDGDQRSAIRATWASVAKTRLWPNANINAEMQILFVLAHKTPDSYIHNNEEQTPKKYVEFEHFPTIKEWAHIKTEADIYGDVLYLNMQDSYYNLTLKLLSAFKWVDDHCSKAKFILKVDTDTFVNVPLLLDTLIYNEDRLEYSLIGQMYTKDKIVLRSTKWAVDSEVYPPTIFPVYASELAYVMSARLLHRIIEVCPYMPLAEIVRKSQRNVPDPGVLYITGVLGFVLGYDYYSMGAGMFTDHMDRNWFWCDMIHDKKIAGLTIEEDDLYKLWRSFFRYYGKCWKEIPALANPSSRCAYVVSRLALSALVEVFPYFPAFPIEDAFTTGVLARITGIQHMSPQWNLFTDNMDFNWDRCDFVKDLKMAGTGVSFPFKLRNMWAGIIYDDDKCELFNLITMNCYCNKNEMF